MKPVLLTLFALLLSSAPCQAQEPGAFNAQQEELLSELDWENSIRLCIGVTRLETKIWCVMDRAALDYRGDAPRILAIAGLGGGATDWSRLASAAKRAVARRTEQGASYQLAVIGLGNPDGYFLEQAYSNGSGGDPSTGYPPEGTAYNSKTDPERTHLWRFIAWFAPDLLIEVEEESSKDWQSVLTTRSSEKPWSENSLAAAVQTYSESNLGQIPTVRMVLWDGSPESDEVGMLRREYVGLGKLSANPFAADANTPPSAARLEMQRRLNRTPLQVLKSLAKHYAGHLERVSYQPGLAVMCRARLGELVSEQAFQHQVEKILAPYLNAEQPSLTGKYGGSQLAGHLVFADWAARTGNQAAAKLVVMAAENAFHEDGSPKESMPFHNEMSDAVFMACPILCAAGRLSGEQKYIEMADRHLTFMQSKCLREDGIYRHSPLCEAAWGRGNGFPALGLAMSIEHLDALLASKQGSAQVIVKAAAVRERFVLELRKHLTALLKHQDPTGMWRQVIDEPGAYREMTSTCMISYAMITGLKGGWLDKDAFEPAMRRAWDAVNMRVSEDGTLFDVCTGTGKQQSLRDYYDRTAIWGPDERGGAMAMMFASQLAGWEK